MICRSFSIASEVERDWPPSFSRLATPFSFYLAPLFSRRISSTTAHSTSLRTFEKLITTSLSLSLCCVHYFSASLPGLPKSLCRSIVACYDARSTYASLSRCHDGCVYSRDGSSAKVLKSECKVLRSQHARKLNIFY